MRFTAKFLQNKLTTAGLIVSALALLAAPVATLTVSQASAQDFRNGNWRGKPIFTRNRFSRCEISVGFVDGRRLYIMQFPNNNYAIGTGKPGWSLVPGNRPSMNFEIVRGKGPKRSTLYNKPVTGRILRTRLTQVWFPLGRNLRLISALQRGTVLYINDAQGVTTGGTPKRYGYNLNDVRSAMLKLTICVTLYGTR